MIIQESYACQNGNYKLASQPFIRFHTIAEQYTNRGGGQKKGGGLPPPLAPLWLRAWVFLHLNFLIINFTCANCAPHPQCTFRIKSHALPMSTSVLLSSHIKQLY